MGKGSIDSLCSFSCLGCLVGLACRFLCLYGSRSDFLAILASGGRRCFYSRDAQCPSGGSSVLSLSKFVKCVVLLLMPLI
uniref:Uncharacterized protein n=1 Tax=Manihot esculenta TaxID=3983 RepID=A0A199UBC3_MANES